MYIEIDNVELSYSTEVLLKGIYLKAETGKITSILGTNGCGKSSLLKVIFGSLNPHHKLIRINNKPHLKPLYTYKGIVKYLPQDPFIPTHLKLKTVFKVFGVSWEDFVADFSNHSGYQNYNVNELSGGERRIVEIYLILKSKAEILLLDEPFTHLAPIYIEQFKKLLKAEARTKAIILTDHLYQHIIDLADDLYLIKNGCTKLVKDPRELEDQQYLITGS
ncbi:ATP-binding cassette domain-containing protein [Antarcticibacterium sp. 1MA-6-2]|uniref:ATP-binding cassette domain-containing protein n=1 Tax=Antarcticibacterium sp. 1MA-6-2 TaxID=2908210 RepID=UPI001F2D4787|nr:ATP-binding cassette domain-containing protein [Antarcticibacterium sp. 1MA-6-2]UJH92604.1 ATP-binding cassette domain-containing protein [Antarcticibacterium sp. 1MA-6-2]